MKYLVYILYSAAIDKYYIGHTGEPMDERLRKHLSNHSGYTAKAKDWSLRYNEEYSTKAEAYAREREIKKKKSRKYIQNQISSAG
ncbi:GIY-YIG nuclease family protein [Aequorivita capsosiphonis]|uniref:GIY-YIG nuclease family protein n=1 Tax=Aequorivita capsosiphonis TaxID=487317 RepID=UPI00047CC190|nr:GIY-YIG nuclease family protein [Aequorivita capsosiphonis]